MMKLKSILLLAVGSLLISGCAGIKTRSNANKGLFQTKSQEISQNMNVPKNGNRLKSDQGYSWPLSNGNISSYFGKRRRDYHDGLDISAPRGTPIHAAKEGVVIYAARRIKGYGNMVVLKHGNMATVYAHNSKNLVKKGDKVKQGEVIGFVGATGKATGPHVHFEIRQGQIPVDPLYYLPAIRTASQARND